MRMVAWKLSLRTPRRTAIIPMGWRACASTSAARKIGTVLSRRFSTSTAGSAPPLIELINAMGFLADLIARH